VKIDTNDLYLAFIGFSKRGSVIDRNSTIKSVVDFHRDFSYKPKLFLFEKSIEDKLLFKSENSNIKVLSKLVNCFG